MSRSIDLFIECPKPIEEVVAELARLTGLDPVPGSLPGTWSVEEGGVHAELRAHPYVDDGDLTLERYHFALSARVSNGGRLASSPEATLLRMVADSLHKGGIDSLLVHDLQYRDRGGAPVGPDAGAEPGGDEEDEVAPARTERS